MTTETESAADMSSEPENSIKGIDREALKRLDAEIQAKAHAKANQEAAAGRLAAEPPTPETAADMLDEIPDPELRRAIASLRATIEANPRSVTLEPQPAPEPTAKIIHLDFWEEGRRAAPNIVFRSALFPAMKFKEGRPFLKQKQLFSTKGGEVYFTGEQFDQSDLDVYLEVLQFARLLPLGTPVRFSAYSMLRALGRNTGKSDHQWLHAVIVRLGSCMVEMTDHKMRYGGALIHEFTKNEITGHYEVIINPKFAILFGYGLWSTLDKGQRHVLKRSQTAKALHAYYSTHAAPGPHEYATLAEVAGLTDKNPRKVKMKIIAAHEELKRVGFMANYETGTTTIKVTINHTPSQAHHIVKKIIKSRKAKKDTG